ncbi:MAG: RNA polymerase sigma factor, partial [Fimbriiglobus sp.]
MPDTDATLPGPDSGPGEEPEWIAAAQRGDRAAFARLVDAYWDRLYRWLYQMTRDRHRAEDLVQETFLKALAGLGSFRPGTNFRAWLFRIGH